jgi:hypothetical protein
MKPPRSDKFRRMPRKMPVRRDALTDEVRLSTSRSTLDRAIELGFRDVHFRGADAPAFCRDARRAYLWALHGGGGGVELNELATRIESPISRPVRRRRDDGRPAGRSALRSWWSDSVRPARAVVCS